MKKIFTVLSIVFALLAGSPACGNTKDSNDSNDADRGDIDQDAYADIGDVDEDIYVGDTGDTDCLYGIEYTVFIKASGSIMDEKSSPIENIDVSICYNAGENCEFMTKSAQNGSFDVSKDLGYLYSPPSKLSLKFSDPDNQYVEKSTETDLKCDENLEEVICKSEELKIIMTQADDEDSDLDADLDADVDDIENDEDMESTES